MARIYDSIVNVPGDRASAAALATLEGLQQHIEDDKGAQSVGLCAAFLLLCEHLGVQAQDVFTATKNLMNQAEGPRAKDFQAVRDYLRNEVRI